MRRALLLELGAAMLALLTGWMALWAWRGLVELPERFLGPTLIGGAVIAAAGAAARARRLTWYAAVGIQLVVLALFLNFKVAQSQSFLGIVPTRSSLAHVAQQLRLGGEALATQYSPVPVDFPGVHDTLVLCSLGILLVIDLLACGLRRTPLAALPVLVIWMIPISLLLDGVDWPVFALTGLLFVMLLATEETRRVLAWGRAGAGRGRRRDSLDQLVTGRSVRSSAFRIGLVTCAVALVVPIFIPLANHSFSGFGQGSGPGGETRSITIDNPLVDLRRDLVRPAPFPMLRVETAAPDPGYVRLTVLDEFSGAVWRPSGRQLFADQEAEGELPTPPGLSAEVTGQTSEWDLRLLDTFSTVWLPTPYPLKSIRAAEGDWRYDERTLDFAAADGEPFRGTMDYELTAFRPDIDANSLDDAFLPPMSVREPMTELPDDLPEVIRTQAEEITDGEVTNYRKAIALQEWFRSTGGFTYSLDRAPGSGMEALEDFITTDRVGYCEQFAAAMAVMGRALDIPSRVVVGFLRPEPTGGDSYVFDSDDLHAWPEMFFTGIGWVRFEPTPSTRTGTAPGWTTEQLPTPQAVPTSGAGEALTPRQTPGAEQPGTAAEEVGAGDGGLGAAPWIGVGLALLLLATPRVLRDAQRRSRLSAGPRPQGVAAGLWAELQATAVDLGISWHPERSARQTGRALVRRLRTQPELRPGLEELVQFIERARYGRPFETDPQTVDRLRETVRACSAALATTVAPNRARWAKVFPRSSWRSLSGELPGARAGRTAAGRAERSDELVGSGRG